MFITDIKLKIYRYEDLTLLQRNNVRQPITANPEVSALLLLYHGYVKAHVVSLFTNTEGKYNYVTVTSKHLEMSQKARGENASW